MLIIYNFFADYNVKKGVLVKAKSTERVKEHLDRKAPKLVIPLPSQIRIIHINACMLVWNLIKMSHYGLHLKSSKVWAQLSSLHHCILQLIDHTHTLIYPSSWSIYLHSHRLACSGYIPHVWSEKVLPVTVFSFRWKHESYKLSRLTQFSLWWLFRLCPPHTIPPPRATKRTDNSNFKGRAAFSPLRSKKQANEGLANLSSQIAQGYAVCGERMRMAFHGRCDWLS